MNGIAHLSFERGGMILPCHTPYERELLVECVELWAKRHGSVRLAVNGRHWTIETNDGHRRLCSSCSQWPDDLTYPGGPSNIFSVMSAQAPPCAELSCRLGGSEA